MSFITLNQIQKSFEGQTVIQEMNLEIKKGELVTFLGPSGCGKSTLLRMIAGLVTPEEGSILIDGRDVTNVSPKDRGVGMVFQSYALFPNMNVYENVAFGLKMKKMEKGEIHEKVMSMIELVGLTGKEKAYPHELSGGQQQRVALARSVVVEPKVLLLDEPLSALDAQIRKNLQKLLRSIQQRLGITMILVTHDQEEAMVVSDRIVLLNNGQMVQNGHPHDIYMNPATEFAARFIGHYNVLDAHDLRTLFGQTLKADGMYAIRPEAFQRTESGPFYAITAVVKDVAVLGNIVRYSMESNSVPFSADLLQQRESGLSPGSEVTLYILKEDVIPLT
ncbi:ABC transporter ATP-binding protein [Rossellomorea vietnamensis]|uniref:ABC transporter ATP-binding protein n=1 Tax=Rossellomorea vietnamensis TaxID=218284 RepID=A0ACD4CF41_9BACI|nr:ABC transporter ATP-binding protein [Rossellomorea vietnamensis]UXH46167.1 ABC transporter ATP-binding protein [Rossellomorea vietnamensis]